MKMIAGLLHPNGGDILFDHQSILPVPPEKRGAVMVFQFPNFAYWPHRVALLQGHMPVSKSLPYEWYDTPNLRCATINDFEALANQVGLDVLERVALHDGKPVNFLPNWRGSLAVFRLKKNTTPALAAA